jgi:hypothetical protein
MRILLMKVAKSQLITKDVHETWAQVLWDFSETMYHQFGVQLAILAGCRDPEGDPTVSLYVFNQLNPHMF